MAFFHWPDWARCLVIRRNFRPPDGSEHQDSKPSPHNVDECIFIDEEGPASNPSPPVAPQPLRDPLDDLIAPILNRDVPTNSRPEPTAQSPSPSRKRDPLDDLVTDAALILKPAQGRPHSTRPNHLARGGARFGILTAILTVLLGLLIAKWPESPEWFDSRRSPSEDQYATRSSSDTVDAQHSNGATSKTLVTNREPTTQSAVPANPTQESRDAKLPADDRRWPGGRPVLYDPAGPRPIGSVPPATPRTKVNPKFRADASRTTDDIPPRNPEELFARVSPSVVRINVRNAKSELIGIGSGFFVRDDSTIVTNFHVMEGAHSAEVVLNNGTQFKVIEWEAVDPVSDIVVLHAIHDGTNEIRPLPLAGDMPKVASKAFAIGAPTGLDNSFSEGSVAGHREMRGRAWIQITAPISPGSSGSPVFNERGLVIGMATMSRIHGQNLNFALASRHIREMIPDGPKALSVDLSKLPSLSQPKNAAKDGAPNPVDPQKPTDDEESLKEAERHIAAGVMRRALQVLDEVPDEKRGARYWRVRATALFPITAYREAADCYSKSIKLDNSDFDTWFRYALSLHLRPKDELAIAEWRRRRPVESVLQSYVDDDLVIAACRSALKIAPNDPRPYLLMGLSFRNDEERVDAFKTALSLDDDDIGVHYHLGCAFVLRRKEEARKHFKKAIDLVPKLGVNYEVINRGRDKSDVGRSGWEDKLNQFTERNSLETFLKLNLAAAHDGEERILICQEVLKAEPKNRVATHMIREAMKMMGRIRREPNEFLFTPPESWGELSLSAGTAGILVFRK